MFGNINALNLDSENLLDMMNDEKSVSDYKEEFVNFQMAALPKPQNKS